MFSFVAMKRKDFGQILMKKLLVITPVFFVFTEIEPVICQLCVLIPELENTLSKIIVPKYNFVCGLEK